MQEDCEVCSSFWLAGHPYGDHLHEHLHLTDLRAVDADAFSSVVGSAWAFPVGRTGTRQALRRFLVVLAFGLRKDAARTVT